MQKNILSIYPIALFFLTLLGCKSSAVNESPYGYDGVKKGDQATVMLSVRFDNHCEENPYTTVLEIEGISNNKKSVRKLDVYKRIRAGDFDDPPGYFYVQSWPAGQYHISQFSSVKRYSTEVTLDLDIYFDLMPGTVNYLGQFILTIPKCSKYQVGIENDLRTALKLLKEQGSDIESSSIISRVRELSRQLVRI
ncbi:MAG: hypothetical protein JAY60_20435 [Candidatus Thiodiazotropha weberae]|nr:hypothetical protein [Candidatus Thiodiazotropha weberae]